MKSILLVEDDFMAGNCLKLLLERREHKVTWVKNVADGIKEGLTNKYDLIILDIGLPDGKGYEVSAAIVADAKEKNYSYPRMVACSANINEETTELCLSSGMVACYGNPVGDDVIDEMVTG